MDWLLLGFLVLWIVIGILILGLTTFRYLYAT